MKRVLNSAILLIAIGAIGFFLWSMLQHFSRARAGSRHLCNSKLVDCTNASLRLAIRRLPANDASIVLALPRPEMTNELQGISGVVFVNTTPPTSNFFSLGSEAQSTYVLPVGTNAHSGNLAYTGEMLTAFVLMQLDWQRTKVGSSYAVEIRFSNPPPPETSIWLRWLSRRHLQILE